MYSYAPGSPVFNIFQRVILNIVAFFSMEVLPIDIIFNIFSRISGPVTSLLKLRCVSKTWCKIIDDPSLSQFEQETPLIIPKLRVSRNQIALYAAYDNKEDNMIHARKIPMAKFEVDGFCDSGSCNGLLYFAESRGGRILVSNPLRNQFRVLPPMNVECHFNNSVYGLGFDSSTKKFKMVCTFFSNTKSTFATLVHTFGTTSWREIPSIPNLYHIYGKSVFVHGFLHWTINDLLDNWNQKLLSFDVSKEKFKLIPHPTICSKFGKACRLLDIDHNLAMVDLSSKRKIDIWVMDYEKKEWSKRNSIGISAPVGEPDNERYQVLGIWKQGEILLYSKQGYYTYSMKTHHVKYKHVSGFDSCKEIYCHRGNLISIDDAMEVSLV